MSLRAICNIGMFIWMGLGFYACAIGKPQYGCFCMLVVIHLEMLRWREK